MALWLSVLACAMLSPAAQSTPPDPRVRMGDATYTHAGGVFATAGSPDGKLLISAGADGSLCVWEFSEFKQFQRFEHPETAAEFVAVSVDGSRAATGSPDKRIRLWNLPDGKPIGSLAESRVLVAGLAFTASETLLISARSDGTLALWDTSTEKIVKTWTAHRRGISALAASRDGTRLATTADKEGIALWNPAGGERIGGLEYKGPDLRSLVFSPDGKRLAAGAEGGRVVIWDLSTGRVERERTVVDRESILALAFSPDGIQLACGSARGDLVIWDTAKDTLQSASAIPVAEIRGLAYSADGTTLASADAAGRIVFRDAARGDVRRSSSGHEARIRDLAYSPAGDRLASGGDDRAIRIWDAATGKELLVLEGSKTPVTSLSYSPDGRHLVSTAQEPVARLWDAATGKLLKAVTVERNGLTTAAWRPDGASFAVGATNGRLHLVDVAGNADAVPLGEHTHAVTGLLYSPWAATFVSTSYDSTLRIWDPATRKESARFAVTNSMPYAVAVSPDGLVLAVASVGRLDAHRWVPEHVLTLWDTSTGQKIGEQARFETLGPAQGRIEFAPGGRRIFVLRDGVLKAWSLPGGQELSLKLKSGTLTAFRFSPDGRSIALAMDDLTIAVRDLADVAPPPKAVAELDAAALATHWDELARPEADRAFKGVCALADSPKSAVEFLGSRVVPVSFEEVERLIEKLGDDDAGVRDRAAKMIRVVGTPALLEQFLERKPPLETALRIRALIADQKEMKRGDPELDRALRSISVLEMAGTPEAKSLLQKLAAGTESARQTQAAQSALRRLAARPP